MIQKLLSFILHSRLENVLAIAFTCMLLVLFLCTHVLHAFNFGTLNFLFILLPVGVLGVKSLLELLLANPSDADEQADLGKYLVRFFQPQLKIFRDWFPFLLLCTCYYSLYNNLVLQINPHLADSSLSKIDGWILGNQISILLEPFLHPWLTDFLSLIYFSHVLFFPSVALYFYVKKEERAFRRIMMGFLTIMLLGIVSYLIFPAAGPEKFLANVYTHNLDGKALSHSVAYVIGVGRISYDCFPSLHVGIPLLVAFYLRAYRRRWFVPAMIYVALMCAATLYLRYHYLIDVIGSFLFAPAAYFLNDFLLRIWPGERINSRVPDNQSLDITENAEPA